MILMTFIENAFKFGISNHEHSVIKIQISVTEGVIDFFCENTQFWSTGITERTGIGLINTRQRLDYLYKDNYDLKTGFVNGLYTVRLQIISQNSNKHGSIVH